MDVGGYEDWFVAGFTAETTEAFLEGHVCAFAYFDAVPTGILYDNTKSAVARILGGEERQRTRAFSELQSYYLFADKFGRREYVQVLRLMKSFASEEVTHAVEQALRLGAISFDAVRHLLLCRIERRPRDCRSWVVVFGDAPFFYSLLSRRSLSGILPSPLRTTWTPAPLV